LGGAETKERRSEPKVELGNELQKSEKRVSPMKEAQLRVRPWVEDDDDTLSNYVPLHLLRARQYARLMK